METPNYDKISEEIEMDRGSWSESLEKHVRRPLDNIEVERLLVALAHDVRGTESPELSKILRAEWWNS